MAQSKQVLSGEEALQILEARANIDLKRARQLVEEAATADLGSYFKGSELAAISSSQISTLVSAAIAGGQWGFNALVARLSSSNVPESDFEKVANDVLELVSPLTKILNYARFRSGAVQSYVAQVNGTSTKLEKLAPKELSDREQRISRIRKTSISDENSLHNWANEVDELCELISNAKETSDVDESSLASRSKRGSVSTKSISSYSKHWHSYALEILSPEIGLKWRGEKDSSISARTADLEKYKGRTWSQLQKDLGEAVSTRRVFTVAKKQVNSVLRGKLVTAEHEIDGRLLKITYDISGLDEDLIEPTLKSFRAQLILDPKLPEVTVTMRTDSTTLSIHITRPNKGDIEAINVLLNSHR
jgi:hypothetical protein